MLQAISIFCLAAAASVAAAPLVPAPLLPAQDPFYLPPAGWNQTARGSILRSRKVTAALYTAVPLPVTSYQLLFVTSDAQELPLVTVTTILVPTNAAPGMLLAYSTAEDSVNTMCSPSYQIQQGSSTDHHGATFPLETGLMESALAQGVIVTMSDHEGPNNAYAAGPQEGRAVLDSIRATLAFGKTIGLAPTARSVVWGYSGGATASSWAEALQASYAPELLLVGGAHGGTPADLRSTGIFLNNTPRSGFLLGSLIGLANAFPDFHASFFGKATPKLLALIDDTVQNQCGGNNNADNIDFFATTDYFTTGPATIDLPPWKAMFARTLLGTGNKTLTPAMPIHVYHAIADNYIPYSVAKNLVDGWCGAGANVEFITDTTPEVEHILEVVTGSPGALLFLMDRLNGVAFAPGCTYTNVTATVPFNSPPVGPSVAGGF